MNVLPKTWKVWADGDTEPDEPNVAPGFDTDEDAVTTWAEDCDDAGNYAGGEYPEKDLVNVRSPEGVLSRLILTTDWSPEFSAYEVP